MASTAGNIPEVSLEVIGGASDGLFHCAAQSEVHIGRENNSFKNDLPLRNRHSSRRHSRVYFEDGQWLLVDLGSQNGTKLKDRVLTADSAPHKLAPLDRFIVGSIVIEFRTMPRRRPVEGPPPDTAAEATEKLLAAARDLAAKSMRPYVCTEHLFITALQADDPAIRKLLEKSGQSVDELVGATIKLDRWTGDDEWIKTIVEDKKLTSALQASPKLLNLTPRGDTSLILADQARRQTGAVQIDPIHVLIGIVQEGGGVPVHAIRRMGRDPERLALDAIEVAREHYAPEPEEVTRALEAARPERRTGRPPRKPVDQATWLAAVRLHGELRRLQVRMQLDPAEERFQSLVTRLREGLGDVPPQKRADVFHQLELMLPVFGRESELPEELPLAAEATPAEGHPATGERMAVDPLAGATDLAAFIDQMRATTATSGPAMDLLRAEMAFAFGTEQFVKALLKTVDGGTSSDTQFYLPSARNEDLALLLDRLAQSGDPAVVERIRVYLDDLRNWQVAIINAYQEAVNHWNELVWQRINPLVVERETEPPGVAAAFGSLKARLWGGKKDESEEGEQTATPRAPADCWETYRKKARDLAPDVTNDEFKQLLARLITRNFQSLKRSSRPGGTAPGDEKGASS